MSTVGRAGALLPVTALALVGACGRGEAAAGSEESARAAETVLAAAVEQGAAIESEPTPAAAPAADHEDEAMPKPESKTPLHPTLASFAADLVADFDQIPADRREALEQLAGFVRERRGADDGPALTFICTHNSRRSHMSQLWAATAAAFYGVEGVTTHSGGTEATAFNPRAVAAMTRAGFQIENPGGDNPRYEVSIGPDRAAMTAFSKVYDDPSNPQEGFAAVMTCSQADAACPIVRGAGLRISLPYVDPKEADDTPEEAARYDERCRQIGTEMMYLFSKV